MEYRTLGRSRLKVSAISLGTEYLIGQPREHGAAVIHEAIAQGINYFDLFFAQPEFRDTMGAIFQPHRKDVMLAGHLGATWTNGQSDKTRDPKLAEEYLHDFLRRYHTDYVDVLMLHNCDPQEDYDRLMQPDGLLGIALEAKRKGTARLIGFSGHTPSTSLQAVASGHVDLLMFPINLAGHALPGKKELFEACAAHNVALVAMKPYAGGKLLQQAPSISMENWQTGGGDLTLQKTVAITPAQCLAYVMAQPGLSTIVPGCKDVAQLHAALAYFQASEEERDFSAVMSSFQRYIEGECVYCNHCLPCPSSIDIGQTIRLFELAQSGLTDALHAAYDALETDASDCVQCGTCEDRCPFGVQVIGKMEQAAALFG